MKTLSLLISVLLLGVVAAFGATGGSIAGTVTDSTGSVISGAFVVAINVDTHITSSTTTNASGSYSFPDLPVGHYTIQIRAQGFSNFQETGIVLDVNTAFRADAVVQVNSVAEHVDVSANPVEVDTISTQLGQVIESKSMTSLPLNGRSYTDLLALQPGVAPASNEGANGVSSYSNSGPSGGLSDGTLSISGARGSSNGFMVNGGNVQEQMANGTAIIPNVDSIEEFRIITNNFDAEYGHYSGGLVNVVTKSGTNQFHGNAFEFVRNTALDATQYFAPTKGTYHQNQFGGTFGGPIVRDKLFFFADYQGTRQVISQTANVAVPSLADTQGNLSDLTGQLTGTVQGAAFAQALSNKLGRTVNVGDPFYTIGCTASNGQCVFPGAVIPQSAWSAPAANLLQFIPKANSLQNGTPYYSSSANSAPLQDDKAGLRVDGNTAFGLLSGYYFVDKYSFVNPFANGSSQSSFGNFGAATSGMSQLFTFGDTKSFGASRVNEFRMSYTRNASFANTPTGPNVDLASIGFTVGCGVNTVGICPQDASFKTLPAISLNNFTIGGPTGSESLRENTYQVQDNYSWTVGAHNVKFGGIFALSQINMQTYYANNGLFEFNGGTETGSDFADFLLGATSSYQQGVQLPLYNRGLYYGLFAQDSWRATRNLTINYGLRWDVTTPWWEKYNRMEALVPGKQSVVFPAAPQDWLVSGDPAIPKTIAPVQYGNVAPRLGLAYSPNFEDGWLGKLLGKDGTSSIRASFGMFYGDLEDYTNANGNGDAPYGLYWVSPSPAFFATPFGVPLSGGNPVGQRFPIPSTVANATASHPDPNVNWAQYEPISSSPTYYYRNVTPYIESWMLSFQRKIARSTVLTTSYVGNVGRHNMVIDEANPANPAACLSVSQPSQVAQGSNLCGPNAETGSFTTSSGQTVQPRQQLGAAGLNFGSTGWYRTMGASSYNALEASLQYTKNRTAVLVAYTFGKSMDDSSAPTEQVMPFNPRMEWALSAFDVKHNFVASYSYELPFEKLFHGSDRLTKGWTLSGIVRFASGFPVTIYENDDRSLIGNTSVGPTGSQDEPNYTGGHILAQTDPRKGGTYFNTSLFSQENLGQFGNAKRRFFSGPGINNWNLALAKNLRITESKSLELRAEFFNAFNHAQFLAPNGLINSSTFGQVTSAADPRIGQIAAKFNF